MMISDIEDYFPKGCGRCDRFETPDCSAAIWRDWLVSLRRMALDSGLEEAVKWGHPCYMHKGRNIAIMGAFRGDFRLTFFDESLMKDPHGILAKHGPNSQCASKLKFSSVGQVAAMQDQIAEYLLEAKGYAEAGIKAPKIERSYEMPDELTEALDADPELAEAFNALTPGRQKSYVINLNGAKKFETRVARIAKFRAKIIAGKGAMER